MNMTFYLCYVTGIKVHTVSPNTLPVVKYLIYFSLNETGDIFINSLSSTSLINTTSARKADRDEKVKP